MRSRSMPRCPRSDFPLMSLPLADLRVLDLTIARAGPTAVRQLADWGADVVRIERPPAPGKEIGISRRLGHDYQNLHATSAA